VNSCVLKHPFNDGVQQPKKSPKTPGNTLSDALQVSRFEKMKAGAAKKTTLRAVRLLN